MTRPDPDLVGFGERILSILDRGSFTSTYKFAVLLGLIDLSLEKTQRDGTPPTSVTTSELADRVTHLYWPHTRDYPASKRILRQNRPQAGKTGQAEIIQLIADFRAVDARRTTAERVRFREPSAWMELVRDVEWKLVEMPLPRLQRVGTLTTDFLYVINWDQNIKPRAWRSGTVDNLIRFQPGVAEALVRLAPLLRPLIERQWSGLVAEFNRLPEDELDRFLFGADRTALSALRAPLRELQSGRCFYCARSVSERDVQVDHFVPWARHPNNSIENLVAAHSRCNGSKSDHLPAADHVGRWLVHLSAGAALLQEVSAARAWPSGRELSVGVARGIYLRLPDETLLWRSASAFEPAAHDRLMALFASA
jgi:5-methylcytosine-specific restriction endonuclease McrA